MTNLIGKLIRNQNGYGEFVKLYVQGGPSWVGE